jgi:hypothetical protein
LCVAYPLTPLLTIYLPPLGYPKHFLEFSHPAGSCASPGNGLARASTLPKTAATAQPKKKVARANSLPAARKKTVKKKKKDKPQMEFVPHAKSPKQAKPDPDVSVVSPRTIDVSSSVLVPKQEGTTAGAAEASGSPGSSSSPQSAPAKPKIASFSPNSVADLGPAPTSNDEIRAQAKEFVLRARALGVRLPPDNIEAQIKAGTMLQATKRDDGSFDVHAALQEMGWDGKDGTVETSQEEKADEEAAAEKEKEDMGPNFALVKVLQEISLYYFKAKETHRGINFKKAAESLKNHKVAVKSGKEAAKLKGIGKSTAAIIDEVFASDTGTCTRLEAFRDKGPL